MKKLACVLILVSLAATSAFAKEYGNGRAYRTKKYSDRQLGLGLNLGYPGVGLAFRYRNDKNRVIGCISYDFDKVLAIDASYEYAFASIMFDDNPDNYMDFTFDVGAGVQIPLTDSEDVAVIFELGPNITYNFPSVPLSIFLRVLWRPTLAFSDDKVEFDAAGFGASLGITYNFDLKK